MTAISNRYEFVYLFDVRDGNPNGDPDGDNMPRLDVETGQGLVTDVCVKRKVRNYVEMVRGSTAGYGIYVTEGAILNDKHAEAHNEVGSNPKGKGASIKISEARLKMCERYYDVRTFGAMMATDIDAGTARGAVQLAFARSIDPITPQRHTITRMAATKLNENKDNKTMGAKWTVPYGLYRMHGYVSAPLAAKTGFSEDDLDLFWRALGNMMDHDRSATRGEMSAQRLIFFKHDSQFGNAPSHKLFSRLKVGRMSPDVIPRSFEDYEVTVDASGLEEAGVEVIAKF